jgi:hypothetical protein
LFCFIGIETKGRSIEEIDADLARSAGSQRSDARAIAND